MESTGFVQEISNDLQAAIEVKLKEDVKVLYPDRSHKFHITSDEAIEVCLRDDATVVGTYQTSADASGCVQVSESFGSFGKEVTMLVQQEQKEAQKEKSLLEERTKRMQVASAKEVSISIIVFCALGIPSLILIMSGLILGTLTLYAPDEHEAEDKNYAAYAVLFVLGLVVLLCCHSGWSVGAEKVGVVILKQRRWISFQLWASRIWWLVGLLFGFAAVVWFAMGGCWWCFALVGLPCLCLFAAWFLRIATVSVEDAIKFVEKELKQSVCENTIVFHGKVLPDAARCICSWPGKYESAWDALVKGSRAGSLSAAVVFLPEGSELFGIHDRIPKAEGLDGSCWCTQLYGEEKPWGCHWWSKWILNIEKAVQAGSELQVYYFHSMRGKGKVQNFLTAGEEHLRREAIYSKKEGFQTSPHFQKAQEDGLEELSKDRRGDSSSPYSREVHRLFLAQLPEEERHFLEASEGLGNSQKAEVAWLERKGYAYSEVEVDITTWLQDEVLVEVTRIIDKE